VVRLAIAKDFLAEYAKLDKGIQKTVDEVVAKITGQPDSGLCLERRSSNRQAAS
jgi:hypothetical protein